MEAVEVWSICALAAEDWSICALAAGLWRTVMHSSNYLEDSTIEQFYPRIVTLVEAGPLTMRATLSCQ
jgi:hypothetical protein